MPSSYSWVVVGASFAIALLSAYVTLDLVRRVHTSERRLAVVWWGAGSVVIGTGIWSMHFLGMQAFKLPIAIGFSGGLTLLSWLAAVSASAIALALASRKTFALGHLVLGALTMGAGISGMHYIGMAAMQMSPGIIWKPVLVTLSVLIAVFASATALLIFKLLRRVSPGQRFSYQLAASFVMAIAICGMHYTGMAAASFPVGAVCLSAGELGGPGLTAMVLIGTGLLLVSTMFTTILATQLQNTSRRLTGSLQESNDRLQAANDELQQRAFADALTGLPNRLLFEDRLRHALLRLDRSNRDDAVDHLGILFVDLDGFKVINDSFGHLVGDAILQDAAARLSAAARDCDTVARVGGDEFLMLIEGVADESACITLAQRVLEALSHPFEMSDKQVQIGCSIGIVVYPDHSDRTKLVANADAAMYAAKRAGGGGFAIFEPHMASDASGQLELQNDLRHALDRGQLHLHYQPKMDRMGEKISGVEALMRWTHPIHGMVSPSIFVPLAERFGFIGRLGNWVLNEACRQTAEWARNGIRMRVAINLSVHQLREGTLVERVEAALRRNGLDASQLLCEITESVAMADIKTTQQTFDGLARIGVFLAIDDFGTGYSSLAYLRQLPAQQLKIDRSFINDIEVSEDARAVVRAIISLAHALGLSVVGEGVETLGQRDVLVDMGCDELQGFFYAKPMSPASMLEWSRRISHADGADSASSAIGKL